MKTIQTFPWIAALVLLALPQAMAQDGNLNLTAAKNQMTPVGSEVRLIEEASLPAEASLQAQAVPRGSTAASQHGQANYGDDAGDKDNGMKLYRFLLAPGESFSTRILSDEATVVTQRFGLLSGPSFTPASASQSQITRANRQSRQQRSTKIDFRNSEPRSFPLLLIVYGQVGHPYKIRITREQPK